MNNNDHSTVNEKKNTENNHYKLHSNKIRKKNLHAKISNHVSITSRY